MPPVLHQIEGGAVHGYRLKPPWLGLFFDACSVVVGLALDDAELMLTVVIIATLDERDLPRADTKHPADLTALEPGGPYRGPT